MNDRDYCLVPDCDEAPYPGDVLCITHQREDARRENAADPLTWQEYIACAQYCLGTPLVLSKDNQGHLTFGYGNIQPNGTLEYPMPYSNLNENHKAAVDLIRSEEK